jgi:hypothetical protein
MVTLESIEALQERFSREPAPKLKRQPARKRPVQPRVSADEERGRLRE